MTKLEALKCVPSFRKLYNAVRFLEDPEYYELSEEQIEILKANFTDETEYQRFRYYVYELENDL